MEEIFGSGLTISSPANPPAGLALGQTMCNNGVFVSFGFPAVSTPISQTGAKPAQPTTAAHPTSAAAQPTSAAVGHPTSAAAQPTSAAVGHPTSAAAQPTSAAVGQPTSAAVGQPTSAAVGQPTSAAGQPSITIPFVPIKNVGGANGLFATISLAISCLLLVI